MTITADQVVLMESQVMADTDDGGGRMSGNVVIDDLVNNTFSDISRMDRVNGRTSLRKLFKSVQSANQDTLLGSHTIISKLPEDPRIRVTLFKTGSHTDRRTEARDRIESYVVKATEAQFWLWGDQLAGQRSVQCLQFIDWEPPEPGQVFTIVSDDESKEQYVRVTGVEIARQKFVYSVSGEPKEFEMNTLAISLGNTLNYDFDGSNPSPFGQSGGTSSILSTQVADAAEYFGASPTTQDAAPSDTSISVDSVYNHLVPSAQSESPLVDRFGSATTIPIIPTSDEPVSVSADNVNLDSQGYAVYYTGRAIVPGSLIMEGGNGNYSDNGGKLKHSSGSNFISESFIDYPNGIVRILYNSASYRNTPVVFAYFPGAPFPQQGHSFSIPVTIQTRSLNYIKLLRPYPAPGTVVIEYRALGRWQKLIGNGKGVLTGQGNGAVNFATGIVNFTLTALPDVGSRIIFSWGDAQSFDIQSGASVPAEPSVTLNVSNGVS